MMSTQRLHAENDEICVPGGVTGENVMIYDLELQTTGLQVELPQSHSAAIFIRPLASVIEEDS